MNGWTQVWTKAGESLPAEGVDPLSHTRKHGPGDLKSPPVERREAPLRRNGEDTPPPGVSGGCASRSGGLASLRVSRRSAPLLERSVSWDDGVPGAFKKNTGDDARLFVIPGSRANPESRNALMPVWIPGPVLRTVPE